MRIAGIWRRIPFLLVALLFAIPAHAQVVTTTTDNVAGSLRAAITFANGNPGTTITFALATADAGFNGQTYTFRPTSALPAITAAGTIIDGSSQTALGNTNTAGPEIVINGGLISTGATPGLQINAANCTINSLIINGFSTTDGLRVSGTGATGNTIAGCYIGTNSAGTAAAANSNGILLINGASRNTIGGTTAAERNVISGNTVDGIRIDGSTTTGNIVRGNYVGITANGAGRLGNGNIGVHVRAPRNTIGGTTAGARNVISANGLNGIGLSSALGPFGNNNIVQGNYIGTDATGTRALGNARPGIAMGQGASNNLIGGTATGAGNVVSGNVGGISMFNPGTNSNLVQGNLVGLAADGVSRLGNTAVGIELDDSTRGNVIGGTAAGAANRIAYSTNSGIRVAGVSSTGNSIRANVIFANAGLGINLEPPTESPSPFTSRTPTPNDVGDVDSGPNNLQNFPVLTVRRLSPTSYSVSASLDSTPSTNYALDLYRNSAADALGYGEGETFVGSLNVTTNDGGVATTATTVTVPAGSPDQFFTMTATNLRTGDTSEFSVSTAVATATLTLSITPTSFSETAGSTAATGTLVRTGALTAALPVTLTSSDASEATVPASVTIPAGSDRVTFRIAAIDDALSDGSQTVIVTASATGFAASRVTLTITDDETGGVPGSGLVAWGDNSFGQLGNGTLRGGAAPVAVRNSTGVVAVAAGGSHSLALLGTGAVISWGYNGVGQLGDGTRRDRSVPGPVSGITTATAIAAGWYHSMALLSNGTVVTWGVNRRGQLGIGSTALSLTPRVVPGLTNVVAIAAGVEHSMALRRDGVVFAWGANDQGQIGDGSRGIDRITPVAVRGLRGATSISGGASHSLAVAGGTVYAWGDNSYGQLGIGNEQSHAIPQRVARLSGISTVAAGYVHSAALSAAGRIYSWGNNFYGQLGDGTTTDKNIPVAVSAPSSVVRLAVGTGHNVALLRSGQFYTWGFNLSGATGTSSSENLLRPTLLPTLSAVTLVSAGYAHTVSDGTIRRGAALGAPEAKATFSAGRLLDDGIQLQFEGTLDLNSANNASNYGVWVDGRRITVETATYYPGSGRVVLQWDGGSLVSGSRVHVAWNSLKTTKGEVVEDGNYALTSP